MTVVKAKLGDLESLVAIDHAVIGNDSRRDYIRKALVEERCLVANGNDGIGGFLIWDTHFFDCSFISLVIVSPSERRKGYATALLEHFTSISPTYKIFSSTNRSNRPMQEVFASNGFVQSGYIDNLDEGDPELIYFKTKLY